MIFVAILAGLLLPACALRLNTVIPWLAYCPAQENSIQSGFHDLEDENRDLSARIRQLEARLATLSCDAPEQRDELGHLPLQEEAPHGSE